LVKLTDALNEYVSGLPKKIDAYPHQELHRFVRWVGWEHSTAALTPPQVAQYAENVVKAGGDVHGRLAPVKEFLTFLKRKGISTHSLAPHVKIPRASRAAARLATEASDAIHLTPTGHAALQQELVSLKAQRPVIIEAISTAAADKDFKENAPLDAAREDQGKLEARIREVEATLHQAVVVDLNEVSKSQAAQVGNSVVLHDMASGKELRYILVDSSEADPSGGKISVSSPVGKAVVGCRAGDEVDVVAPKGLLRYKVASIEQ
jgi:transcription elongation factor GreA